MHIQIKRKEIYVLIALVTAILLLISYKLKHKSADYIYINKVPTYNLISLLPNGDQLEISIDTNSNLNLAAGNYIKIKNKEYLSFINFSTKSIEIADIERKIIIKKVDLSKKENLDWKSRHVTAYFKNFDSIYLSSQFGIFRFDSSGRRLEQFYAPTTPTPSILNITNYNPILFDKGKILLDVNQYLLSTSTNDLRKRSAMINIDFKTQKADFIFDYPPIYHKDLYGVFFLLKYHCQDEKRNIIFSYPADANIYKINLDTPSRYIGYNSESKFFKNLIPPVENKSDLETGEGLNKTFLLRDSYGPIYYDPFSKRYLRIAEQRITNNDWNNKFFFKKKSIIILNEKFEIIGETNLSDSIAPYSLYISHTGIFMQTRKKMNNGKITFVKYEYYYNKK